MNQRRKYLGMPEVLFTSNIDSVTCMMSKTNSDKQFKNMIMSVPSPGPQRRPNDKAAEPSYSDSEYPAFLP